MPKREQPDSSDMELSRSARLAERREQRRNILVSFSACSLLTLVVGGIAASRFGSDDSADARVKLVNPGSGVLAERQSSFTLPVTTTTEPELPELDPLPPLSTDPVTTTVAPTTTTALVLPPGFENLFTTTLPTTTTTAPAPAPADIQWSATPSTTTVQSGAQVSVRVTARNVGGSSGTAMSPSCPSSPVTFALPSVKVCAQGAADFTLAPGASQSWTTGFSATSNGDRTGNALKPGRYFVTFGGATIILNVVP